MLSQCVSYILSLPSIGERAGIRILRYDFSDPQAGKDVCDRRIANLKSHMWRFINEGNDINTVKEMKVTIESYGGVKGCYDTCRNSRFFSKYAETQHDWYSGTEKIFCSSLLN